MNFLENPHTRRSLSRKPEPKKNNTRLFGKQITNLPIDKPKLNQTLDQRPTSKFQRLQKIVNVRPKPTAFTINQSTQSTLEQKDSVYEYEAQILNEIQKDNECIKPIKCTTITLRMRAILIDWMVDVHSQFELKEETLFLSIRILDQYLSTADDITKKTLQLVGITCLWMASKYEQIYPPRMKNYVTVTDNTYSQNQIHQTEAKILSMLNFNILKTTSLQYISAIMGKHLQSAIGSFCRYLLELSSFQFITTQYKPRVLVCAVLKMSQRFIKEQSGKLKYELQADASEISGCFKHLCKLVNGPSWQQLGAIKRKYNKVKFHSVGRVKLQKA